VKKAYRQLALRYHPDRTDIDQKEEAKTKFQIIGKIYAILSDDEKRKIYDDTGMKYLSSIIPTESIFRCYG
jgi:DnaJ family protein C protein 9